MKTEDIKKAKQYLESFMRLSSYGHAGRFLSPEYQEFKKEKPHPQCNLLEWCVKKALDCL